VSKNNKKVFNHGLVTYGGLKSRTGGSGGTYVRALAGQRVRRRRKVEKTTPTASMQGRDDGRSKTKYPPVDVCDHIGAKPRASKPQKQTKPPTAQKQPPAREDSTWSRCSHRAEAALMGLKGASYRGKEEGAARRALGARERYRSGSRTYQKRGGGRVSTLEGKRNYPRSGPQDLADVPEALSVRTCVGADHLFGKGIDTLRGEGLAPGGGNSTGDIK